MPGMGISLNAMVSGTSQLPRISLEEPKKIIGSNTVDCMKSGILYGTASVSYTHLALILASSSSVLNGFAR